MPIKIKTSETLIENKIKGNNKLTTPGHICTWLINLCMYRLYALYAHYIFFSLKIAHLTLFKLNVFKLQKEHRRIQCAIKNNDNYFLSFSNVYSFKDRELFWLCLYSMLAKKIILTSDISMNQRSSIII